MTVSFEPAAVCPPHAHWMRQRRPMFPAFAVSAKKERKAPAIALGGRAG